MRKEVKDWMEKAGGEQKGGAIEAGMNDGRAEGRDGRWRSRRS